MTLSEVWKEYFIGFLFLFLFIYVLQMIGKKCCKRAKRFTTRLIIGYVCYTALMSAGGIIIRLLELDWLFFVGYMGVLWLALLVYAIDWKGRTISSFKQQMADHVKHYYPLYLISFLLLLMGWLDLKGLWGGNRMDDGWYVTQISQLPEMGSTYTINPPTGFSYTPNFMRIINTYEMEAAFYSSILHISATIYVKAILAYFHYFLLCTGICELVSVLWQKQGKQMVCSLCAVILLFFAFHETMLQNNPLLVLEDHWQFNTAMGYGSSVVRTMGLLLLLLPIFDRKLFTKETIGYAALASFALITKASQALPAVYLAALSLFLHWLITTQTGKKKWICSGILLVLLCCIPLIGSEAQKAGLSIYEVFHKNFATSWFLALPYGICYILIACLPKAKALRTPAFFIGLALGLGIQNILWIALVIWIHSWHKQHSLIRKWNSILMIMLCLMFVPGLNHLFLDLSVYEFVAQRTVTLVLFTLIVTAFIEAVIMIAERGTSIKKISLGLISFAVAACCFFTVSYQKNYSIVHALAILKNNPQLLPNDTLIMADHLSALADEKQQNVHVVLPMIFNFEGMPSYPYILLRLQHKNINVVSAVARYGEDDEESVRAYTDHEQTIINACNMPDTDVREYADEVRAILQKYPMIDTFVVTNPAFRELLVQTFDYEVKASYEQQDKQAMIYILSRI